MERKRLANEIAQNGMLLIKNGKIRNHKLDNSSRIHTGEVEKEEYQNYRDFLRGKNGCMVYGVVLQIKRGANPQIILAS